MAETQSSPIVGIDLGTTNSVVAAVIDGRPEVLTEAGEAILPSVVGIDASGKLVVGQTARNQHAAFPDSTIASVKRQMGSMAPLKMGDQTFSPPEISAMILRRLRERASAVLGTEVTRAVITVPAFFDENQRQATRQAGELAGLTVERIINEPTAATLVYHSVDESRKNVLVYDFGGGTFDVSVVRIEDGVIEVLSSRGDTKLGGDDLDTTLLKHVADVFRSEHQVDLLQNASSRWRLLRACEAAKCQLSSVEHVTIREEFIAEKDGQPLNLNVVIARGEYEDLIASYIDRTIECLDQALRDAKLGVAELDDLVLVGGSTRTPMIADRLRSEFGLEPSRAVDPDLAVALGAATQAAMLQGQAAGPVLVDVTSHTLGIAALTSDSIFGTGPSFSPIIHRGSPLPANYEEAYYAVHEDQEAVNIRVYQGEHVELERNVKIGEFLLDLKNPSGDRGKINVRFDLSLSGTLKVTAQQTAVGKAKELTIDNALQTFKEKQLESATSRLDELFDAAEPIVIDTSDKTYRWGTPTSGNRQADVSADTGQPMTLRIDGQAENLAQPPHIASGTREGLLLQKARAAAAKMEGEDADDLNELADRLEEALASEDTQASAEIAAEIDDVLFYVNQ